MSISATKSLLAGHAAVRHASLPRSVTSGAVALRLGTIGTLAGSGQGVQQAGLQANAAALQLSPARPSLERSATTELVTLANSTTTAVSVQVGSLVPGGSYSFSAASSFAFTGKRPAVKMTLSDDAGNVIKTVATNTLKLSTSESAKLSAGNYTIKFELVAAAGTSPYLTSYTIQAKQELSRLPSTSGDADLNAILAGGSYWWHDAGDVASASGTAVTDKVTQINGARSTVYYDFLSGQETYLSKKDKKNFKAMDGDQQQAVVTALNYLSSLINVQFVKFKPEEPSKKADIEFGTNDQTASAGYANYPLGNGGNPSVVMLDNTDGKNASNTGAQLKDQTSYAWYTLIHELGHAMGLKHPGKYNAGGGSTPPPYLSSAKDNRVTTAMSYKDATGTQNVSVTGNSSKYAYSYQGISPTSYKVLDIAALQYLYGAKKTTVASTIKVADGFKAYEAVWAPKGVEVDASETTRSNVFDLRPGGYSSISILSSTDQVAALQATVKEKLGVDDASAQGIAKTIANSKALKGKLFDGKNTLGLAWGSAYTQVTGGSADDQFYAGAYSATVDGGAGSDTLYLQGVASDWTLGQANGGADSYTNNATKAVITAKGIEAVKYYNATAVLS